MNKDDMFRIGVITEPHGIKGEVKVFPTTDEPARIGKLKEVYLDNGKELLLLHPLRARAQNNLMIVAFEEFQDRDAVERLRKHELYVTRENAVKLHKDEYYISDLIGLKVIDEDDIQVGIITEVLKTGANDVYEIKRIDDTMLLLPAIKQCILDVNISEGFVRVHVLEGL